MRKFQLSITVLFTFLSVSLHAQSIIQLQEGKPTSIRGLSVVNDSIAWVSGNRGCIGITRNGGKDWSWQQVKGFEKADFRDIEAFSDKNAVIMSSGTPALVLKTTDGGNTWQEKYRNTDTTYFFDAMDFADGKHGFILGDPINGKFLLMETNNGGETWHPFNDAPTALQGEAAFAASGTCLRTTGNQIYISSGGTVARLIIYNGSWHYAPLPITHGQASEGAFSLAIGRNNGVIAGGDYAHDKKADSLITILNLHAGVRLATSTIQPGGFQSSVEFLKDNIFLSTGTPGSNITTDGGKTWKQIDTASFNVCRKAKHGKLVLLAGNGGKIGMLKM
ncbi:YCF48-related protein [Mucilaginibacter sp. L3T2-6]|uniref:WD40/YVTN/BNR-like repeat-containing protein n=1 Tax=Mucilaginibacter sp. L3T2-6 TaxID=3062491 RepID=UPI002674CF1E|nr:YCF48-related protein [Mucilaginibacter sp. L3T2-6]MDO3644721.1 YCF48-related protein [Mucilaginibacter sp. L3T2-6]MDV6217173.1 YCF48-related protein [Mucilaginibacter sp. L3T2-6]